MPGLRKLDLYVALTFLGPFVLSAAGFIGLYVVIDFFSDIDEFRFDVGILRALYHAVVYYALRVPSYVSQIMPVLTVVPAVICMIRLARSNELCAMRSSGISARRISAPLVVCGAAVMALALLNQEVLVPALHAPLLAAEQAARGGADKRLDREALVPDRDGRLFLIGSYDPETPLPTLKGVHIHWRDPTGLVHRLRARRAFAPRLGPTWYMEGVETLDRLRPILGNERWLDLEPQPFVSPSTHRRLREYEAAADTRTFDLMPKDREPPYKSYQFDGFTRQDEHWRVARNVEVVHPSKSGDERVIINLMVWLEDRWLVFGSRRYRGIDPETGRLREEQITDGSRLDSSIKPSDIRVGEFKRASAMMTLSELADVGSAFPSRRFRHRCWVILWNRLAFPLANVLLVLLAVPLVFRQRAHTAVVGITFAVLMALLFLVANLISIDLAYRQWFLWRWPFFAGTFPTALFGVVGVWVFIKADRV